MIYRFVPGFGDEIAGGRSNRIMQGAEGKAAAVISSPATLVAQGIKTHSTRADNNGGGGGGNSGARPGNPVSGGVAAHSSRTPNGGGASVPSAAPAPRASNPANTPHASNNRNSTGGDGR
jgi:hypothetical protein